MKVNIPISGLALFIVLATAGCESIQVAPRVEQEAAPQGLDTFVGNYFSLEKGMTEPAIKQMFGEPQEVELLSKDGIESQVWKYSKLLETQVRTTTKGLIEEVYWNIFENRMVTREVAVEGTERNEVEAIIELLLYEGRLVSWKDQIRRIRFEY